MSTPLKISTATQTTSSSTFSAAAVTPPTTPVTPPVGITMPADILCAPRKKSVPRRSRSSTALRQTDGGVTPSGASA